MFLIVSRLSSARTTLRCPLIPVMQQLEPPSAPSLAHLMPDMHSLLAGEAQRAWRGWGWGLGTVDMPEPRRAAPQRYEYSLRTVLSDVLTYKYFVRTVSALFPNTTQKHCFLVFLKAPPTVSHM